MGRRPQGGGQGLRELLPRFRPAGGKICWTAAAMAAARTAWAAPPGIVQYLQGTGIPPWLATLFIAMLPIFELRGAIPVGSQVLGLPLAETVALSVVGNMLPIAPILLLLGPVSDWLSRWPLFGKFFQWLFARTRSRSDIIRKYELIGLMLFVAVPLPVTGAWTGAAAAFLFGIRFWPALGAIFLGVLIAGAIVTALVLMGIWGALVAGLVLSFLAASAVWRAVRARQV